MISKIKKLISARKGDEHYAQQKKPSIKNMDNFINNCDAYRPGLDYMGVSAGIQSVECFAFPKANCTSIKTNPPVTVNIYAYKQIFSHLPTLKTKRLLLRKVKMSDSKDMFEYTQDIEVARHVLWDAHTSIFETRSFIRFLLKQYKNGDPSNYAIEYNNKVIGTVGFMSLEPENKSAEVGYSMSREFWNKGIMTEALNAIIQFGFEVLRLNRIEAKYEFDNAASGKVMKKCGMHFEGKQREKIYNKGRYADIYQYAILRKDYENLI